MIKNPKILVGLGIIALCIPLEARADAIIPYMAVPWGQAFLLPIVILIEGIIIRKLAGGSVLSTLFQSFIGNIISTALGAVLYLATIPLVGERLFYWWFKGEFGSETLRNACIALAFATVLGAVSWSSETLVIARLRKVKFRDMALPCAWANLVTYILLLGLALWFQK